MKNCVLVACSSTMCTSLIAVKCADWHAIANRPTDTHTHVSCEMQYVRQIMGTYRVRQNCRSVWWLNRLRCRSDRFAHINLYNRAPSPSYTIKFTVDRGVHRRETERANCPDQKKHTHVMYTWYSRSHACSNIINEPYLRFYWKTSLVGPPNHVFIRFGLLWYLQMRHTLYTTK